MRGSPRVQYRRVYLLLPPDANAAWAKAAIDATWDSRHLTIGRSADDAGIGDLDERHVIVVNATRWPGDIGQFFASYYPGVTLEFVEAGSPEQLRERLGGVLLWQKDPRWRDVRYGGGSCPTIGQAGCWITCCAMAQRYFGIDREATPLTVDAAVGPQGYRNCRMLWSAMPRLGLTVKRSTTNKSEAIAHLNSGVCFAEVAPASLQHFVLVTRYDGKFWMYDPLKNVEGYLEDHYTGAESWRLVERLAERLAEQTFPLRGVHDLEGGQWLAAQGLRGWCTEALYLEGGPQTVMGLQELANRGVRVILRLNYSYATDDGGKGTIPPDPREFERAALETMRRNPAAWGFIYCNEVNNPREWPRGHRVTPQQYVASYNRVWAGKPEGVRLAPMAIDPYNAGWGDWRRTWNLGELAGADFLAWHAFTHHADPNEVESDEKFQQEPLTGVYYNLRVVESLQQIVPNRFRNLPQVVTETNHLTRLDGSFGWERTVAREWIRRACAYLQRRGIAGVCLFRYNYETWSFKGIPEVLQALRDVD